METEREMSRYEVTPIGIFLETWDGSGGIKRKCILPRDRFVEAYEKWIKNTQIKNTSTEKIDTKGEEYNAGYEDGTKARDDERGTIYHDGYGDGLTYGYEKGLKHGQELRAEEVKCAYACGMKSAWEAARKIYDIQNVAMVKELFGADANYTIYNFTASEVIEKIAAWGKKQEQIEKRCTTKARNEYEEKKTYEQGANDAWELARKMALSVNDGGFTFIELIDIFEYGTAVEVLKHYSFEQAFGMYEAYKNEKNKKNEINVGDEVCQSKSSIRLVVTKVYRDEGKFDALGYDGTTQSGLTLNLWEKTGRGCEIW